KEGTEQWREGLPLLRINREVVKRQGAEPFRCGNLFAGSLLNLAPDTRYEVRLILSDPDGGRSEKRLMAATRGEPLFVNGKRQLHLYPPGYSGPRNEPGFEDLHTAMRDCRAGDVILLHAGTYPGNFRLSASGTVENPIVFRAAGDGEAIVAGTDGNELVFDVQGRHHVWFERLVIRNGSTAIKANGSRGLVVRRCRIEEVNNGVISYASNAADWFIADNVITGRVEKWYPRRESSDTAISCAGSGHVISHNRIRRFWDGISTANCGVIPAEFATAGQPPQMAIDIDHNDISEMLDDGIETDDTLHNIRVLENRLMNVHTGLSVQPHLGGPLYLIRNAIYNTTYTPLKLHNHPTGVLIFHNTWMGADQGLESWPPTWRNATLRNNLIIGARGYAIETGSPDPHTTLDYNGWRQADPSHLIKWSTDAGASWSRFESLAAFQKATGHETHGLTIDYGDFLQAAAPLKGETYPVSVIDLRLRPESRSIDAGIRLPMINDDFSGHAPDMGSYEAGKPLPVYGPRE
ncbi:MAG: hypothetical protein V4710_22005, partial [Verrucomicrobiota bacterium]